MTSRSRMALGGLAILGTLGVAGSVLGRTDREVLKRAVDLTTEERLDVELSFGAGVLQVHRGSGDQAVRATLEFPEGEESPEFSYRVRGRTGDLRIEAGEVERWEKDEEGTHIELDDEGWGDWWTREKRNDWTVALTDRVPIALRIESGASKNDVDLTGLRISHLDVEAGACEFTITVKEPSPHRARVVTIDGGAARFRAENLGHLNFDRMEFNGGAGQFTLGFGGALDHRATVEINVGVGQLTILVPEDLGVKLDCSSCTLASVSVSGDFDEEDRVYVNSAYGKTRGEILFEVSASLATVNVETTR